MEPIDRVKVGADKGKDPGTYKISDPSWAFLLLYSEVSY